MPLTAASWNPVLAGYPQDRRGDCLRAGALLTFILGYRQKERERTVAYYHKVVTDERCQTYLRSLLGRCNPSPLRERTLRMA